MNNNINKNKGDDGSSTSIPNQQQQQNLITGAMSQEPIAILLSNALINQNIQLSKRFFITLLQSRETYARMPSFRNIDAMASYGEGTHSQIMYLVQEACYSVAPKVSQFLAEYPEIDDMAHDLAAHIGQATGIAGLLKGFTYYGSRGSIILPVDVMTKSNVSQHEVVKLLNGGRGESTTTNNNNDQSSSSSENNIDSPDMMNIRSKLSDVVFETATRANDHILSASNIIKQLNEVLKNSIPDAILVPALNIIPTKLFLERLEKYNFDIMHPNVLKNSSDWRLPLRSYKAYKLRRLD